MSVFPDHCGPNEIGICRCGDYMWHYDLGFWRHPDASSANAFCGRREPA